MSSESERVNMAGDDLMVSQLEVSSVQYICNGYTPLKDLSLKKVAHLIFRIRPVAKVVFGLRLNNLSS